ncbi:hypothetical protein H4R33_001932 [Dimargaris cristalligena]|nr:hypothetical protein H4R33_001932 [Dimargaris cristalligena]
MVRLRYYLEDQLPSVSSSATSSAPTSPKSDHSKSSNSSSSSNSSGSESEYVDATDSGEPSKPKEDMSTNPVPESLKLPQTPNAKPPNNPTSPCLTPVQIPPLSPGSFTPTMAPADSVADELLTELRKRVSRDMALSKEERAAIRPKAWTVARATEAKRSVFPGELERPQEIKFETIHQKHFNQMDSIAQHFSLRKRPAPDSETPQTASRRTNRITQAAESRQTPSKRQRIGSDRATPGVRKIDTSPTLTPSLPPAAQKSNPAQKPLAQRFREQERLRRKTMNPALMPTRPKATPTVQPTRRAPLPKLAASKPIAEPQRPIKSRAVESGPKENVPPSKGTTKPPVAPTATKRKPSAPTFNMTTRSRLAAVSRKTPATTAPTKPSKPAVPSRAGAEPQKPAVSSRGVSKPALPAVTSRPVSKPARPAVPSRTLTKTIKPAVPTRPTTKPLTSTVHSRPASTKPLKPTVPNQATAKAKPTVLSVAKSVPPVPSRTKPPGATSAAKPVKAPPPARPTPARTGAIRTKSSVPTAKSIAASGTSSAKTATSTTSAASGKPVVDRLSRRSTMAAPVNSQGTLQRRLSYQPPRMTTAPKKATDLKPSSIGTSTSARYAPYSTKRPQRSVVAPAPKKVET